MTDEALPPGVVFLDHTADVGLDIVAPTLGDLFARAATGMACLIHGSGQARGHEDEGDVSAFDQAPRPSDAVADPPGSALPASDDPHAGATRPLALSADDLATLLRVWLRETLHWHEAEGLVVRSVHFGTLTSTRLEATVSLALDAVEPVREIKGVTLHALTVERRGDGWAGRVIFDV